MLDCGRGVHGDFGLWAQEPAAQRPASECEENTQRGLCQGCLRPASLLLHLRRVFRACLSSVLHTATLALKSTAAQKALI